MNKSNNTVRDAQLNVQFFDDNGNLITLTFGKSIISNPGTGKNSIFSVRSDRGDDTVISHSTSYTPMDDLRLSLICLIQSIQLE